MTYERTYWPRRAITGAPNEWTPMLLVDLGFKFDCIPAVEVAHTNEICAHLLHSWAFPFPRRAVR